MVSAQDFVEKKISNENGGISLVVFKENSGLTSASTKTLFQDILKLRPTEELRLIKSEKDFTGKFTDDRYQLYQNNIKELDYMLQSLEIIAKRYGYTNYAILISDNENKLMIDREIQNQRLQ